MSVYEAVMMIPFIGMYFGPHTWTEATLGFCARTIALVDTMADSPQGQVDMIVAQAESYCRLRLCRIT
jgi:hypothetical protein